MASTVWQCGDLGVSFGHIESWGTHLDDRRIACQDAKLPKNIRAVRRPELVELVPQDVSYCSYTNLPGRPPVIVEAYSPGYPCLKLFSTSLRTSKFANHFPSHGGARIAP